jgi:hypothetical protein
VTLSEIEQDVYRRTGKNTSSPDTVTQTRIRAFINQRQRRILAEVGVGRLRDDVFPFTSVALQQRYGLSQAITKIHAITDPTNGRAVQELSLSVLRTIDPQSSSTVTGTPDWFVPLGYTAVANQPSNASQIWAVSSAAGDTQNLTIETMLSTGERRVITQALTGITAVQIGTLATHLVIERIYVATAAAGTITILEDSGTGTELARITIGQTAPRYYSILLYPTPSAAITYTVDAAFEIADMSVAGDVPYLPPDFHFLLSVGARLDEYEKTDDEKRRAIAEREWAQGLSRLKWHLYGLRSQSQLIWPRRSNLGPWFPPGVW